MWTKTHSVTSVEVTKEQMWKLFSDVNSWNKWDTGIEFASIRGPFEKGNHFTLKPRGGPKVDIELVEVIENEKFIDLTKFPLAEMYGEHTFEETPQGLKITTTMRVKGLLGFLWIKLVAQGIVSALPVEMQQQVKFASKL